MQIHKETHTNPCLIKKVKAIIGIALVFLLFVLGTALSLVTLSKACQGNRAAILFSLTLCIYQYIFAKKSTYYIKFIRYFQIENYFKKWSFIQEESFQDTHSILTFHPHCIYTLGLLANQHLNLFGFKLLGSRFALNVPVFGLLCKLWDIDTINPDNFKKLMNQGQNISIVPGGFEEATLTTPHENRVFIKARKGFIKYCLQYGYTIYPTYSFNENCCLKTFDKFQKFRLMLNKFKMIGTVFWSKYALLLPDPNVEICVVVGKGIKLEKMSNPDQKTIDKYHKIYIEQLIDLYNRHKDRFSICQNELKVF